MGSCASIAIGIKHLLSLTRMRWLSGRFILKKVYTLFPSAHTSLLNLHVHQYCLGGIGISSLKMLEKATLDTTVKWRYSIQIKWVLISFTHNRMLNMIINKFFIGSYSAVNFWEWYSLQNILCITYFMFGIFGATLSVAVATTLHQTKCKFLYLSPPKIMH